MVAGVRVGGVARPDVGPEHVPIRTEDAALRVDVALRRLARIRAEGRRVEARPGRVDVLLLPLAGSVEDAPAVRILPDVEAAAAIGHAAARLGRVPIEAGFAIRVVRDHELAVVPEAGREEAELAVHVPANAGRRAAEAVGVRRVRVDEHVLGRERLPVHQVRVHELALRVQHHVEGARRRAREQQGRQGGGEDEQRTVMCSRHHEFLLGARGNGPFFKVAIVGRNGVYQRSEAGASTSSVLGRTISR